MVGRVVGGVVTIGVVIIGVVVVDGVAIGGCVGSVVALVDGCGLATFSASIPSSSLNASSLVMMVLSGGRTM